MAVKALTCPYEEKINKIEGKPVALRDFQRNALIKLLQKNESQILQAPTGAGKSVMMAALIATFANEKKRIAIIMCGIHLVDQFAGHLKRFDIKFGVYQGNHKLYRPLERVQLCSIDTISRREEYPKADLVVIDEVHTCMSPIWQKALGHYRDSLKVGFSATPYKKEGFHKVFDSWSRVVTYNDLVDKGYLCQPRYFSMVKIDRKKLKVVRGDFDEKLAKDMCDKQEVIEKIYDQFKKHDDGKPTLCFCIDIEHSKNMCDFFKRKGVQGAHIDNKTPIDERKLILKQLVDGKIQIVFNIQTLTTGVDIPPISNILLCRPTKSLILHIQSIGRGSRPYEGKESFRVFDFVGNVKDLGFVEEAPDCWFEGMPPSIHAAPKMTCPSCEAIFVFNPHTRECPSCHFYFPEDTTQKEAVKNDFLEKELEEIKRAKKIKQMLLSEFKPKIISSKESTSPEQFIRNCVQIAKRKNYKPGWVYHKFLNKFGEELANKTLPFHKTKLLFEIYG